jgi:hypothetical protein
MNLIKSILFGFLSSASISFAMMEEETMNQAQQYELRPGHWKFRIHPFYSENDLEQESFLTQSLLVTKSDFSAQLKNSFQTLAMSNASVWACIQAMTPLKKEKLEEGMNAFCEYVLERWTHVLGWEEEGDQFGVGLDLSEAEQIEAMPVRWGIYSSGGKWPTLAYQSGQEDNVDPKFLEVHISYKIQID